MKNTDINIPELIELIKSKKLAILYGAGLSYNSGVFLVKNFYKQILGNLKSKNGDTLFDEKTIDAVISRTSQFEDFIGRLYDDTNRDTKKEIFKELFKVYTVGKPNHNHYFLAYLMYEGYVKTILTTIDDCLKLPILMNMINIFQKFSIYHQKKKITNLLLLP